jgi:hypothetical protein
MHTFNFNGHVRWATRIVVTVARTCGDNSLPHFLKVFSGRTFGFTSHSSEFMRQTFSLQMLSQLP